jgi:hypothetical protein
VGDEVLEHVGQLGEEGLLIDQLDGLEVAKEPLGLAADVGDPVEQASRELAPDDRGQLKALLGCLVEPVDPRGDHVLNRLWDHDLLEASGQDVSRPFAADGPHLLERLDDLLHEEGIALRFRGDQRLKILWQAVGSEQSLCHLNAVRRRQGREGDPGVIRSAPRTGAGSPAGK